ncbi:MAG: cob(I)yrinic acid a,c-diamide adenosyltransferase [Gammaproteobacteria bacterium]
MYTRTGDKGTTGLGDGNRVDKDHPRVEAFGDVDELNSVIGMALTEELPAVVREALVHIQHDLFDLGGELSVPGRTTFSEKPVARIEALIERMNAELPYLQEFILPGGQRAAAFCHLARAVCRRAERRAVSLARTERINAHAIQYLNRLSDLLFVMARYINQQAGVPDVLWEPGRSER